MTLLVGVGVADRQPSWAAPHIGEQVPVEGDPPPKVPAWAPWIFGSLLLVGVAVAAGFGLDGQEEPLAVAEVVETTTTSTIAPTTTTTTVAPTTTAPSTTVIEEELPVVPDGVFDSDDTRTAVYWKGKVYLRGEVPDLETAESIVDRVSVIIGAENVISTYVINPDSPIPESTPLYVADLVLFETGSATLTPDALPLLNLFKGLMSDVESASIAVTAHTDSVASEPFNLRLSQARAESIKSYLIANGISADRVDATGAGETEPIADNLTEDGRQLNRRAEFIVKGILG